jgi:mRNA-degrading endonuclease HigB of HigAB toxin-antitoxin module
MALGRFEKNIRCRQHPHCGRVVFIIKGNDYRLIAAVSYQAELALIKWLE